MSYCVGLYTHRMMGVYRELFGLTDVTINVVVGQVASEYICKKCRKVCDLSVTFINMVCDVRIK